MAVTTCKQCRGTKYRVLVVDDHPQARDMLTTLILLDDRRLDVQSICEAATGEEGVVRAQLYNPHVVLMDIGLPGIRGFDAARKIKEAIPSVEVVMVTAWDDPDYKEEAAKMGVGFLTKYQVGTDLIPLLSRLLGPPEAGA